MSRAALALVRVVTPPPLEPDTQLLRAFLDARSEDAFAELVRRHGPMVLAVCRRVLSNAADADDAFQGTFLVLARKAHAIRGANLAGWLYGVAVRTARGVRVMRERRLKREASAARTDVTRQPVEPADADAAALVDAELARLPVHQREALVLCELQGLSRKAAATELGIAEGTLSSRLAAAKRKLAERLSARGLSALAVTASVPAALAGATAALARGTAATAHASAAAAVVLKGMLFEQLRAGALACAVLLTTVCSGFALTSAPAAEPPTVPRAADSATAFVKQLGSDDFATREAAEKELRALGTKADPAIRAGARSDDPEVRKRCAKLLGAIRKDALAELVHTFDARKDAPSEHPIWKRFAATAGNTPASRALFARMLKDSNWLARLDAAETGPEEARKQYHAALGDVAEIVRGNLKVFFVIPVWPCDTPDQTAFLLFLGSYPGTDGPLPKEEGFGEFIGLANVEARVTYARGLKLALEGKEIAPGPENKYDATAALPEGSAKTFAKLLAAWLPRRAEPSPLFHGFELALAHGATDVLPAARAIAADAERPVAARLAALAPVAQFGDASDLKLFAPLFDDNTRLVIPPPPQNGAARPRSRRPVVADRALGLALLLKDHDPADFGFEYAKGRFRRANGRPVVNAYEAEAFGFSADEARAAAHKKAKAFLSEKPPKADPVALVKQLGSDDFATREAA